MTRASACRLVPFDIAERPPNLDDFYGAALAWQIVYFMISRAPARYRPLMLVGVLAKLSFFGTCVVLFLIGRLEPGGVLYGSLVDGLFMVLFLIAYLGMPRQSAASLP